MDSVDPQTCDCLMWGRDFTDDNLSAWCQDHHPNCPHFPGNNGLWAGILPVERP